MVRYFLLLLHAQLILLTKSLWIPTKVGYNLFNPLLLPWYPSISILILNPSFRTLWIGIKKGDILINCNLFSTWHRLYLLSRQTNIKVKCSLRLDRPPRLIQARMQWCYLYLLHPSPSPKCRHPLPKDEYFLAQERDVRSADLVLRVISYTLSSRREAYHHWVGAISSMQIFLISVHSRRIITFFRLFVPYST